MVSLNPVRQDMLAWEQRGLHTKALERRHSPAVPSSPHPRKTAGTVVLQGERGVGKPPWPTLMLRWAQDTFYAHKGWLAFYLHCRELDRPEEQSSPS